MTISKPEKIFIGIIAVLVIGVIIMLSVLFHPAAKNNDSILFREIIKAKDETILIHANAAKRDSIVIRGMSDQLLQHSINDSMLLTKFNNNQVRYIQIDKQLADVKKGIARLGNDRDSIRSAIAELRGQ